MARRLAWAPERVEQELAAYQAVVAASRAWQD
jgi:hypothetical protein